MKTKWIVTEIDGKIASISTDYRHLKTIGAALADNPQGVRPVAHAVAINPVAWVIPCHLIVPKETLDKAKEIRETAEKTLFKGQDLYLLDSIDVGEFAYGADIKRELIKLQLA